MCEAQWRKAWLGWGTVCAELWVLLDPWVLPKPAVALSPRAGHGWEVCLSQAVLAMRGNENKSMVFPTVSYHDPKSDGMAVLVLLQPS